MTKRKKAGSGGPTAAIGGMLAGFDHQIFRTTPPPHELVLKARPVRGLSGEGGDLEITFPDEDQVVAVEPAEAVEPSEPMEPGQGADPASRGSEGDR
jgi:hypothetical protein